MSMQDNASMGRNVQPSDTKASDGPLGTERRPLGQLVGNLSRDASQLIEREIQLAKAELETKLEMTKREAAKAAVGGAVAYAGVLCVVAAAVLLIATAIAAWLAALLVGVVVGGVGVWMLVSGKSRLSELSPKPEQATRNMKKDFEIAKRALK